MKGEKVGRESKGNRKGKKWGIEGLKGENKGVDIGKELSSPKCQIL